MTNYTDSLIELEEAFSASQYPIAVQKMQDFNNGTRKENLKACGNQKLVDYYDICVSHNFNTAKAQIEVELKNRGMSSFINTTPLAANNQNTTAKYVYTVNDFQPADAQFIKDNANDIVTIIANIFGTTLPIDEKIKLCISDIILALAIKENTVATLLKDTITNKVPVQEIKDTIKLATSDATIAQRLAEIRAHILTANESLNENIEKHNELNPKLWNEDRTLKAEVKEKINEIVKAFTDGLEDKEIKYKLDDIKLVGSNCSFNYNKDSDLDLHLVFDLNIYDDAEKQEMAEIIYDYARGNWNKNHDIYFYDIPVEIFVETNNTEQLNDSEIHEAFDKTNYKVRAQGDTLIDGISGEAIGWIDEEGNAHYYKETGLTEARVQTALKSNGVYSVMNNAWIKEPVAEDIPEVDKEAFEKELKVWEDKAKELLDSSKENLDESLTESKEEDILKARSIIADQIRGEWDADKGYTKAAADLAELKDIDTKEAQDMMLDIASEEHVHVGELETAYGAFDPKLFDELEDGHNEAEENAEPANALDYDITEEPVAEGLDLEHEEECAWCHELFPMSELKIEKDLGPLCHQCIQAIKSHEGEDSLEFTEDLAKTNLCEVLRSISKMEVVVSILNYITGQDYSYLLEKEHSLAGTRLLPKYIIHHLDHNHENNVLDNLYILNRADHQKYHNGLINFDEVEKINLGQVISEFLKDISVDDTKQLESLIESFEFNKAEKIEKFLEDIYELRKNSIAKDGEFGIGNLVFKEIRNKGYLDKLRDLKAELVSKDLSLK